jgi:hypothetical protein
MASNVEVDDIGRNAEEQPRDARGRLRVIHVIPVRIPVPREVHHRTADPASSQEIAQGHEGGLDTSVRRRVGSELHYVHG